MNSVLFCGGFLALLFLSVGLSQGAAVYDDFETNHTGPGDVNGISGTLWTITNSAWKRSTTAPGGQTAPGGAQGVAWAQSFITGDADMGTMTSGSFLLDGNLLQMKMTGFGGTVKGFHNEGSNPFAHLPTPIEEMNNKWELFRASDDMLLSQGTAPYLDGTFADYTIDVSPFQGQQAYLKLTDGATTGYGWMGVDYVHTGSRDATSVFTLEVGRDQSAWTLGSQFKIATILAAGSPPSEGGEFLRSYDWGTGTAQSPDFTITRDTLEFDTAGFGSVDPGPGGFSNKIELRRVSDGSLLYTWGDDEPLGGDNFLAQSTDVSAWMGQAVYLLLLDNVDGGYGWVGIDDVRMSGIPEPGTLALLATGLIGLLCYAWRKRK